MTTFSFELRYADQAELTVVDARGHLVRTLVQGQQDARSPRGGLGWKR